MPDVLAVDWPETSLDNLPVGDRVTWVKTDPSTSSRNKPEIVQTLIFASPPDSVQTDSVAGFPVLTVTHGRTVSQSRLPPPVDQTVRMLVSTQGSTVTVRCIAITLGPKRPHWEPPEPPNPTDGWEQRAGDPDFVNIGEWFRP